MTDLHDACRLGDIPEPGALHVDIEGEPIAIALSEGEVLDCTIECWLHGSAFDLRTGQPLSLPAIVPVPVYPVTIAGEGDDARVLVSLTPVDSRTE